MGRGNGGNISTLNLLNVFRAVLVFGKLLLRKNVISRGPFSPA